MNTPPRATGSAWQRLCQRFGWAWRGVMVLFRTQANARIHAMVALAVVGAGFAFHISAGEWCAVSGAIALVLVAEAINTAIEAVVDLASPEVHPLAGRAKDVAAGAVLIAAVVSVVIGLLVFGPHLLTLIGR
ncbi:MAG: diacylglycerol kinase family protein [Chthoniobacter sp.]